jgi:FKBP-type peptidyl-prolyl cis-trans isomerase
MMHAFSKYLVLVFACAAVSLGAACASYNQEPSVTPSIVTPSPAATLAATARATAADVSTPAASPAASSPSPVATAGTQAAAPGTCADEAAPVPDSIPGVPPAPAGASTVKTASGLQYIDVKQGTGPAAQKGQTATVDYTGWLLDGKMFDASKNHGGTFSFPLGGGQVIKGWDEGVASMHVGGQRRLIIPPNLAYGPKGGGGVIPPCATLIFDVSLVGTK